MNIFQLNINKYLTIALFAFILCATSLVAVNKVSAQDVVKNGVCGGAKISLSGGSDCSEGDVCTREDSRGNCTQRQSASEAKLNGLIRTIINLISVIVGILAVIFIIIGGAKFITSGGDSGKVSSAKNSVIYAVVGLIIVALAQFIVRFVLAKAT